MNPGEGGASAVADIVIIGGGLAGMTVALEVGRACAAAGRKVRIRILERSRRAGGKAGADLIAGSLEDHGFHIFPAWYVNTREILREIGVDGSLIDLHQFHHLSRGKGDALVTLKEWSSLQNIVSNIFAGLAPWHESILSFYFLADLAAEPFSRRAYLDRISAAGFLRSRFYALDNIARLHHQGSLQASSIPYYEISAMTQQKLVRAWLWSPKPFVSIFDGDLQSRFIEPFRAHLEQTYGVRFLWNHNAVRLRRSPTARDRVADVIVRDLPGVQEIKADHLEPTDEQGSPREKLHYTASALLDCSEETIYVVAVPLDEALELVDNDLYDAERTTYDGFRLTDPEDDRHGLADLIHLASAPMAAFHVHFRRVLPRIPGEHVSLAQSRYGITFIDVSQYWRGVDHTALNGIASHFLPLVNLTQERAKLLLLRELREYVPFTDDDLGFPCDRDERELSEEERMLLRTRVYLAPHTNNQLFLNTVGAWHYRPTGRTGMRNVFVAGDYCRSDADLTTMESAIGSGRRTSAMILESLGVRANVRELPIPVPPQWLLSAIRYGSLPFIVPLALWLRYRERRGRAKLPEP